MVCLTSGWGVNDRSDDPQNGQGLSSVFMPTLTPSLIQVSNRCTLSLRRHPGDVAPSTGDGTNP